MKNELYEIAQELVDRLHNEAVTWHAVGMYYLYIKRYAEARQYFRYIFRKTCSLFLFSLLILFFNNIFFRQAKAVDQYYEPSWLGYGHCFAAENDHEQAINAYNTCSQLVPG